MLQASISAFVMLVATIGPLEAAAIFTVLAGARPPAERQALALRATGIATIVLLAFAFGGVHLLAVLHISMPAFRLAGGLLLLLVAIDLMFAHPTGLTSITSAEAEEAGQRDIAVFPLAIPLIAGPGSMAAAVLLVAEAEGLAQQGAVVLTLVAVLALTLGALLLAGGISRLLGVTGVKVIARVSGILLAALAMQLIIDGVRESRMFAAPDQARTSANAVA